MWLVFQRSNNTMHKSKEGILYHSCFAHKLGKQARPWTKMTNFCNLFLSHKAAYLSFNTAQRNTVYGGGGSEGHSSSSHTWSRRLGSAPEWRVVSSPHTHTGSDFIIIRNDSSLISTRCRNKCGDCLLMEAEEEALCCHELHFEKYNKMLTIYVCNINVLALTNDCNDVWRPKMKLL